jgi:hypothetical protein
MFQKAENSIASEGDDQPVKMRKEEMPHRKSGRKGKRKSGRRK